MKIEGLKRQVVTFSSYSTLMYFLVNQNQPSIFLLVSSLFIEIALLGLVYLILSFYDNDYRLELRNLNIVMSSIPMISISLFVGYFATLHFDDFDRTILHTNQTHIEALSSYFQLPLLLISIQLLIAYGLEVFDFIKEEKYLDDVESVFFRLVVVLFTTSTIGIISCWVLGLNAWTTIIILSSLRLSAEFIINRILKWQS
jgi:hypothetical protein